jgi:hypothetical protein
MSQRAATTQQISIRRPARAHHPTLPRSAPRNAAATFALAFFFLDANA